MAVQITKYVQSAFTVRFGQDAIGVDFGSESSPADVVAAGPVNAVFVSHKHPDHLSVANLTAFDASIFCPTDTVGDVAATGLRATAIKPGDRLTVGAVIVDVHLSDHGPNISAPIDNVSLVIHAGNRRIYYLGDMAVATPPPPGPFDAVLVPVGSSKVFDPDAAVDYIESLRHVGLTIPIHYHGRADRSAGEAFRRAASTVCNVRVLEVGESVEV